MVHDKTHAAAREKKKAAQDSTKATKGSFIPVPFIITDQNLGYGGILALVAFTGAGKAFDSYAEFGPAQWIVDYGAGFRWEINSSIMNSIKKCLMPGL